MLFSCTVSAHPNLRARAAGRKTSTQTAGSSVHTVTFPPASTITEVGLRNRIGHVTHRIAGAVPNE